MRGRGWRRFKQELVVKKRLSKHLRQNWYSFQNVNNSYASESTLIDFLGTKEYFSAKTLSTEKYETKNKVKFSPNRNKNYWRDHKIETREYQRRVFKTILKENGLI